MNKKIVLFSLLASHIYCDQQPLRGISFFSPRSQGTNAARDLTGWHPFINLPDKTTLYGACTTTVEYTRSVRDNRIADALFGTDTLFISGSQVLNRGIDDILADYFGLSPAFSSVVEVKPLIQNFLVVFNGYLGLDNLLQGLYIRGQLPAGWTQWNLRFFEEVITTGREIPFPPRYMAVPAVPAPVESFTNSLKGTTVFGQMQEPLSFGKVDGARSTGGIADIQLAIGWNFILNENGHAGLNIRTSIPTGTRPKSEFLFEPIFGNGHHWEFGLGFSGQVRLWEQYEEQNLWFFADANFTHLFKTKQRRSFDLEEPNGFGSRYILIKEFDALGNYTNRLTPLINRTTLPCNVQIDIQLDLAIMFGYIYRSFVFDIGYNGWIRSREKIELLGTIPASRLGLKGIQNVATITGQPSNATQSTATLHGNNFFEQPFLADPMSPVFVKQFMINESSARSPRLITHKFFAYLGYAWEEIQCGTPFFGIGAEIEIEGVNTRAIVLPPVRTTLSQAAIYAKGGVAF